MPKKFIEIGWIFHSENHKSKNNQQAYKSVRATLKRSKFYLILVNEPCAPGMKGTWQEGKQCGSALLKREEISLLLYYSVPSLFSRS